MAIRPFEVPRYSDAATKFCLRQIFSGESLDPSSSKYNPYPLICSLGLNNFNALFESNGDLENCDLPFAPAKSITELHSTLDYLKVTMKAPWGGLSLMELKSLIEFTSDAVRSAIEDINAICYSALSFLPDEFEGRREVMYRLIEAQDLYLDREWFKPIDPDFLHPDQYQDFIERKLIGAFFKTPNNSAPMYWLLSDLEANSVDEDRLSSLIIFGQDPKIACLGFHVFSVAVKDLIKEVCAPMMAILSQMNSNIRMTDAQSSFDLSILSICPSRKAVYVCLCNALGNIEATQGGLRYGLEAKMQSGLWSSVAKSGTLKYYPLASYQGWQYLGESEQDLRDFFSNPNKFLPRKTYLENPERFRVLAIVD